MPRAKPKLLMVIVVPTSDTGANRSRIACDNWLAEKPVVEDLPAEAPAGGFQPLPGPRGVADDLKKLPGVSGAIEKKLNDLGIFHYWQVAELGGTDADKIGDGVGLPGRVEGWIAKAKEFVAE